MIHSINNAINENKNIFAFQGKPKDFFFPIIWCLLWFVYDPYILSKFKIPATGIMILLFAVGFANTIFLKKTPKFDLIGWIFIFALFIEILNNDLPIIKLFGNLFTSRTVYNLYLIFLLVFFIDSYKKIINLIQIILLSIFLTIIIAGLYQIIFNNTIYNISVFDTWGWYEAFDTGRLMGLIYPVSNNSATVILIFIGFILSKILFGFNKYLNYILLLTGLLALFLTYTRGAWFAFAIMVIVFSLNIKVKKGWTYIIIVSIFIIAIIQYAQYNIESLNLQSSRLMRIDYFQSLRYLRIKAFWQYGITKIIIGNGIYSDQIENFYQISKIPSSVHNQFLDFILTFGFIFTIFLYYKFFKQLVILISMSKSVKYNKDIRMISLGLLLSQIGIIASEMLNANRFYYVILFYMLSLFFIRTVKKI